MPSSPLLPFLLLPPRRNANSPSTEIRSSIRSPQKLDPGDKFTFCTSPSFLLCTNRVSGIPGKLEYPDIRAAKKLITSVYTPAHNWSQSTFDFLANEKESMTYYQYSVCTVREISPGKTYEAFLHPFFLSFFPLHSNGTSLLSLFFAKKKEVGGVSDCSNIFFTSTTCYTTSKKGKNRKSQLSMVSFFFNMQISFTDLTSTRNVQTEDT